MVSSSKACREIQDSTNWKRVSGKLSWPTGDSGEVGRWYNEACYFPSILLSRTLSNREIPPGKSFVEIRSKRSAFPKVKLCHCRLEFQSLGSLLPVSMPAPAILGDHTGKMTLYLEGVSCMPGGFFQCRVHGLTPFIIHQSGTLRFRRLVCYKLLYR